MALYSMSSCNGVAQRILLIFCILALSDPILDHFGCTLATTWPLLGAHLGVHGHVWVPAVHGHVDHERGMKLASLSHKIQCESLHQGTCTRLSLSQSHSIRMHSHDGEQSVEGV